MFEPKYIISDQTTLTLSALERLTASLSLLSIPVQVLDHIQKQCLVALTHFSTRIEGNRLSMEQVSGVVERHQSYGLPRDEKEVKNYFRLLQKTPELIRQHGKKIDEGLVLKCHSRILDQAASENVPAGFRNMQNAIYDSTTGKLVYLPPEPQEVPSLVGDLCQWANTAKVHPVILAGIFHSQFVTVHPFVDGNGRTARFLSLYLLQIKGYDWRQIVPIDRYYADDRASYYEGLQQDYSHNYYEGRNETDFTKWIEYYVNGIRSVLEGTLNQVELFRTRNILQNNRQSKILEYLKKNKYVTASHYSRRFGISIRMATRDLRQLVDWNRLTVIGKGRATRYFVK